MFITFIPFYLSERGSLTCNNKLLFLNISLRDLSKTTNVNHKLPNSIEKNSFSNQTTSTIAKQNIFDVDFQSNKHSDSFKTNKGSTELENDPKTLNENGSNILSKAVERLKSPQAEKTLNLPSMNNSVTLSKPSLSKSIGIQVGFEMW